MLTYGSCLPRILVREMKINQILLQNDYKATNLLNVRKKRYITDNHDLDEVPRKAFRRTAGLSWDLKHGRGGESMPVRGPDLRDGAHEVSMQVASETLGRKHKGGRWMRLESEGWRTRAKEPVLRILLRSEAKGEMKMFVQGDAVYPCTCLYENFVHLRQVTGELSWEVAGWKAPGLFSLSPVLLR